MVNQTRFPLLLDLRPLQTGYAKKGIGRYTREMVSFIYQRYPRCRSLVLANHKNPFPAIKPLISMPMVKRPWLWDQLVLPLLLFRHKIRLFQNFVTLGPLQEISLPILYARRSICVVHDLHMFYSKTSEINYFYRNTLRIKLQRFGLPLVRHCYADSHKTVQEIIKYTKLSVKKISVVPVGCDHMDQWLKTPREEERGTGILSIGDTPNKNLKLAMEILINLRDYHPSLTWNICGSKAEIGKQLPQPLNNYPWITIHEEISDSLIATLYQSASLLLFPSTMEGFGIPVLEAMRLGCPVVAGNIQPVIDHLGYDSGLTPSKTDNYSIQQWVTACHNILTDKDLRKKHIEYGKQQSEKYLWKDCADQLMSRYPKDL